MPIYEFKCLKCEEFIEILVMGSDESVEMKCQKCGSEDLERVMSRTHYAMGAAPSGGSPAGPSVQTRNCSAGSCSTIELPGHSR